jgi:hypothetical protein
MGRMSEYQCECEECDGADERADWDAWDDEPYLPVDVYDQAPVPTGIRATLAAMGKLGGGPIPGAGPCPRCKGEYPPYYRHACVSGGTQRTPDGNNALDGVLGAPGSESVSDIPFIEFDMPVPDETGTPTAPADNEAANHIPVPWCHACGRIRHGAEPLHAHCTTTTAQA